MVINKPISTVQKTFTSPFLLDRAKASRILNVIEERFEHLKLPFDPIYFVRFQRGNELSLNRIEDVFALDNTIRNPIEYLRVEAKGISPEQSVEIVCRVSFKAQRESAYENIEVYVSCPDAKLALQAFAALEEQVQRSFLDDWIYRFFKRGYYPGSFLVLASYFVFALSSIYFIVFRRLLIPNQNYERLLAEAKYASSVEQKIDFLFDIARQEAERKYERGSAEKAWPELSSILSLKTLFVILPIVIVTGCIYYVITKCYPTSIFLWGDYEDYYKSLAARRNTIWTVVILSMIMGLIANFFSIGLSGLIKLD